MQGSWLRRNFVKLRKAVVLRRNVKKAIERLKNQEEEHKQTLEELRGEIAQKLMDAQQVMLLPEYGKWPKEKKKKHEDLVAELKLEAQRIRTLERAQALGQEMAAAQAEEAEAEDRDKGGGGGGGVMGQTARLGLLEMMAERSPNKKKM